MSSDQPTKASIEADGYHFSRRSSCVSCKEDIEFWWSPQGKQVSLDPMSGPDSPAMSHFATCPITPRTAHTAH